VKVTKSSVERLAPSPEGAYLVWDEALPGFGVRVTPAGVRSYIAQYRNGRGQSRRMTLGRHGPLAPDAARREARQVLAAAAAGRDPLEERREARRRGMTLRALVERYEREALPKNRPSTAESYRGLLSRHILPALGRRPVADITRADVARLHHTMRRTPGSANRALAVLSRLFNLAERWGLRADGTNPCRHVERYPESSRERFLSSAELARLGDALRAMAREPLEHGFQSEASARSAVAAVRLLVLTGARRSEILNLRWPDVDTERALLWIREHKSGRGAKAIPLNAGAREVLAALPRRSEWVLPTGRGDRPVSLSKPWARIREVAKLEGVRLHDLRHSFAAVGAGAGTSLYVVGKLLGHKTPTMTGRYAHLADDPLREAADGIAARIAAALEGRPEADIHDLSTRRRAR